MRLPIPSLGCVALSLLALLPASIAAAPKVVVSLQPIHSLVTGVMQGVAEPELLIRGFQSPHSYSLRPSDARRISDADLIVWVGEDMESALAAPLAANRGKAAVIELTTLPELTRLQARRGGLWEDKGHADHDHGDHTADLHLWLDPDNAKRIVTAVSEELERLDPLHAETYVRNATALAGRLNALDESLRHRLKPVSAQPYIVFHDAYQYFEARYGLWPVGSVTISPERSPGAKRLHQIRAKLRSAGVRCIFTEPQFEPKLLTTLTADMPVRSGVLDPLGADIPPGPDVYFILLNRLADNLATCLSQH